MNERAKPQLPMCNECKVNAVEYIADDLCPWCHEEEAKR